MIYIVRHGQTAWNLLKRKQGQKDSPLTVKGIEQAHSIANLLRKDTSNHELSSFKIVISPQWRCQQYASIICELLDLKFTDCVLEDNLREHSFGLWEGKNEEEIETCFPGFLKRRYKKENYWSYIVPMGESYELLSERVSPVLKKYEGKNVIYVCHEMVSKVMRGNLMNLDPEDILSLNHKQDTIYCYTNGALRTIKSEKN